MPDDKATSAPTSVGEYQGLSGEQITDMRRHLNARDVSADFCKPYFDKFLRMEKLYHGVIPEELDCTFSKVMLRIPFSIVQNELARSAAMVLSEKDFFNVQAARPELQGHSEATKTWLNYQARTRNKIYPGILPTLTRNGKLGIAYRLISHTPITKTKTVRTPQQSFAGIPFDFQDREEKSVTMGIVAQNIETWNIQPSPTGTLVNTLDNESGEAAEWVHYIDYMSVTKCKAMRNRRGMNKDQWDQMLSKPPRARDDHTDMDVEYRENAKHLSVDNMTTADWLEKQRSELKEGIEGRYRTVWTWFRDKWMLVGEGRYMLYNGPGLLDWFPIAKYTDTPDPDSWFGTGLLETCEDIILAYLLTFNFRMDYLATTLHPTKFVRDDIVKQNGGNLVDFDPTPYGVFQFSKKIKDIQKAIWYDRFPEISPQAFMEETNFKQLLQEITAQPNYMKGMGGAGTLANETATGIVSLIEEGTARSTMRSLNLEYTGLQDELMLYLKWGMKYVSEDQEVQVISPDGWPWTEVPYEAINDGFGIELQGTRSLVHKNEMVKRMLSVLPMLLNNPNVPGQTELLKQSLEPMDLYSNLDAILGASGAQPLALPPASPQRGGGRGTGGQQTLQNESQATAGALAQAPTPAGFAV